MPKPPKSGSLHTLGHASRQWPPLAVSAPLQRKFLLHLSIHLITHGEILMAKAIWVGIAERVLLIKTVRPARFKRLAFQDGKRFATLSTNGCSSTLRSFLRPRGIPRYTMGKGSSFAGKKLNRVTVASRSHWIGEMRHLLIFVLSPHVLVIDVSVLCNWCAGN